MNSYITRNKFTICAFLISYFIFLSLFVVYLLKAFWFRNDDLILSFLLKGIYVTDHPTSYTYHMNYILSSFLKTFEANFTFDVFSVFMYGTLILASVILSFFLNIKLNNLFLSTLLITLAGLPIFLRPTFTTVAGYSFISSLLLLVYSVEYKKNLSFLVSFIGIIFSSLIRDEVVYLGILIAILWFLISNNKKIFNWNLIVKFLILIIALSFSYLFNANRYTNNELEFGQNYEKYISIPINDYGASEMLLKNKTILTKYNYSENDIKLIRNYFNVDTSLASPNRIKNLLNEIGWFNKFFHYDQQRFSDQIKYLILNPNVYLITIVILFSIIFVISAKKMSIATVFIVLSLILFGLRGRIEVYIIYEILLIIFFLILFDFGNLNNIKFKIIKLISLIAITLISIFHFNSKPDFDKYRSDFENIGKESVWNWAGSLPIQQIFPLKTNPKQIKEIEIYDMGWSTFIPGTNSKEYIIPISKFIKSLLSDKGVDIFANDFHVPLLDNYCRENFGSLLKINKNEYLKTFNLFNLRCDGTIPAITGSDIEFDDNQAFFWITNQKRNFKLINGSDESIDKNIKLKFTKPNCVKTNSDFYLQSSKGKIFQVKNSDYLELKLVLNPKEVVNFKVVDKDLMTCLEGEDQRLLFSKVTLE